MRALPIVPLLVAVVGACTPTGATETTETTGAAVAVPEITEPALRRTPFCRDMLALDEALPDDPAIDTRAQVLEAYRDALSDVPAEISVQFRAVIEALESGTRATVPGAEDDPGTTFEVDDPTRPAPTFVLDATLPPAPTGSTTLPTDEQLAAEEGWLPDDDPAAQVNAYIDFACRGTTNNPGPPATQPGQIAVTSEPD